MQTLKYILLFLFILSVSITGQGKKFIGKEIIKNGDKNLIITTPFKNPSNAETFDEHLKGIPAAGGESYVRGGTLLWQTQHSASIGAPVTVSDDGKVPIVAWTLNDQRISLYPETRTDPDWEFFTPGLDPSVAVSANGEIIAVPAGMKFYLLNRVTGAVTWEFTLPDTFYASSAAVTRDGSKVIFAAQANGGSNTARAYCINISATPAINWTFDVPADVITNWAGVSVSASGEKVVLTGRHHLYVLKVSDGSVVWDRFADNTESNTAISGDGSIIATADNSGFVQARLFDPSTSEYKLLWQYRIPAGIFTNWASSVGISADGSTIMAGSLLFLSAGYDGSITCFDTYGGGVPKWIYAGAGDLVDEISISDDGRVAAAVTWGDLGHSSPDLLVFDVATGALTYNINTPGSYFSCHLSADGKRVIAGGKGVHAREFGMGGRVSFADIDLGGGSVTGTVNLAGTFNYSGVIVRAAGTPRFAVTDENGSYTIPNISAGTYTITAEKPGYNFGSNAGVVVTEGDTVLNINFTMGVFAGAAPVLTASNGLKNHILLNWTGLSDAERKARDARIAGDDYLLQNYDVQSRAANEPIKKRIAEKVLLADSITVYRSLTAGGPYNRLAVLSNSVSSFIDSAVAPLRNYYYVVNRFNETGQTVYSHEVVGTVSDSLITFDFSVPQSSNVPIIDGTISPGEWSDAVKVDISDVYGYSGSAPKPQGSAFLYIKFNQDTKMLYVAGEDFLNPALDNNEGFGFYVDDNNNNKFEATDALPIYQEGNYWAYWHPTGSLVRFRQLFTGGGVGTVDTLHEAPVAFSASAGHLQGEFAIPMDFKNVNHLQVYGPDKKIGLGMFLISRDGGVVNYNGWWPQTMNSVFVPQYFGDVQINVNLSAPPKYPSDIAVTQQGNDLLVTWSDPDQGLNNDPLAVPPVIVVYKNNEYYGTYTAGVEQFVDSDVNCQRWYEYQLKAFIVTGQDTLWSPMSSTYGEFACTTPALTTIKYDDGGWEAFYVVDFTFYDNKFALRVTPDFYPARVLRISTLVNSRSAFDYTIQADSMGYPGKVIAGPYRSASVDPTVVGKAIYTLPGDEPPVVESGDLWIVINYLENSPGAPGVGVDVNPPNSGRGKYYVNSAGWGDFPGNLMITTYIASPAPVGVEDNPVAPLIYGMEQNYPNPFNPATVINYQVPETEMVTLEIFDALGQKVRTLVNEITNAGRYSVTWDGRNSSGVTATSGIYFYKIKAAKYSDVKKMMLLR
jgi:hypothetical protein